MATIKSSGSHVAPDEIARAVILPESYGHFEEVVLPAAAWLRENMPVASAELPGYDRVWLLAKYDDIRAVAKDAELFHNADSNPFLNNQADDAFARELTGGTTRTLETLTYMDPPEHTMYRAPLNPHFAAGITRQKYEQLFTELARQVVDDFMKFEGRVCDFVQDFAPLYPTRVTMALMGVPPEDHSRMLHLTQEFFGASDPAMQRDEFKGLPDAHARQWTATVKEFTGFFQDLRDRRREHPEDDITTLVNGLPAGDGTWPDEVANGFLAGLAPAGIHTTGAAVSGAILAMTQFPEQFDLVKANPDLIPGLVDESLRWSSPTKHFMRNATRDTEIRGVPVEAGDRVCMLLFSGNRDEAVYPHPDDFDVTRSPNRHLSFSHGPHVCLGQHIAKVEMQILFSELLPRLGSIERAGEPEREQGNLVSNWRTLPIRFTRA